MAIYTLHEGLFDRFKKKPINLPSDKKKIRYSDKVKNNDPSVSIEEIEMQRDKNIKAADSIMKKHYNKIVAIINNILRKSNVSSAFEIESYKLEDGYDYKVSLRLFKYDASDIEMNDPDHYQEVFKTEEMIQDAIKTYIVKNKLNIDVSGDYDKNEGYVGLEINVSEYVKESTIFDNVYFLDEGLLDRFKSKNKSAPASSTIKSEYHTMSMDELRNVLNDAKNLVDKAYKHFSSKYSNKHKMFYTIYHDEENDINYWLSKAKDNNRFDFDMSFEVGFDEDYFNDTIQNNTDSAVSHLISVVSDGLLEDEAEDLFRMQGFEIKKGTGRGFSDKHPNLAVFIDEGTNVKGARISVRSKTFISVK